MSHHFPGIDQLIRTGQTSDARKQLEEVRFKKLPRSALADFANLCRRVQLPRLAARALYPVVREELPDTPPATELEKAEYAVALQRLGAAREALDILNQIPATSVSQLNLYKAFCFVGQWKYDEALKCLDEGLWLHGSSDDVYLRQIMRVNKIAAQIALGKLEGLTDELQNLIQIFQTDGSKRLQANCLELLAQVDLLDGRLTQAEASLNEAVKLHQDEKTWDQLYIRKWRTIIQATKSNDPNELNSFRTETLQSGHFESLREIDYFLLRTGKSPELFKYLFFGTPHQSYRDRLLELGLGHQALDEAEVRAIELPTDKKLEIFDPMDIEDDLGSLPQRVVHLLLRDFYHPYRVAEIFSHLHPEEYFDPENSPNRVHQSIFATREWFQKSNLKLRIESSGSRFRLIWQDAYAIKVRRAVFPVTQDQIFQWKLELSSPDKTWSRKEIQECLGCAKGSTIDYIRRSEASGQIEVFGAGPSTRYRIKPYSIARKNTVSV